MPNLRNFERRLGGLVEGLFSKTFRSGVQPVEIAKRVVRAMDDGKQVAVNEIWAPNHFEISLSSEDGPKFQQIETAIVAELKTVILDNAGERGWGLVGPPEVEFFVDNKLKRGDLEVEGSLVQGDQPVEVPKPPPEPQKRAQLRVMEDGGVRAVPIDKELLTIGRLAECDIVVHDSGSFAAPRADPHGRRRVDPHRSRLDERHQGERPRRAVRHAGGRRSHHGGRDPDRISGGVMLAAVEPFAFSALKYGLLALLFLFIWRAMRWVVRGLNVDRGASGVATVGAPAADAPPRPSILMVSSDGQKPRSVRLDASTTIGRSVECELRLEDTFVSQQHARIFDRGGNWYVEDLGSTNGTFVNEQKLVAPAMLTPGDKIRIGTTIVELRR